MSRPPIDHVALNNAHQGFATTLSMMRRSDDPAAIKWLSAALLESINTLRRVGETDLETPRRQAKEVTRQAKERVSQYAKEDKVRALMARKPTMRDFDTRQTSGHIWREMHAALLSHRGYSYLGSDHYRVTDTEAGRLAKAAGSKLPKHGYEMRVRLPNGEEAWLRRTPHSHRKDSPKRGWVWTVMP